MLRALRSQRADVLVVPFPSNRWQYSALAAASGARQVLMHAFDHGRLASLAFLAARPVAARRGVHDVVQNLGLLRGVGIEPDLAEVPRFNLREADRRRADALLHGIDGPFAAIHAGSARTVLAQAKRWAPQRYAALIEQIVAHAALPCVLLEGPDEAGIARQILDRARCDATIITLHGSLGDAAALLARADVYVGSDSGLAHLAAAVGTPAVTIFAPADPARVCPSGNRDLVVQPARACVPCGQYPWHATRPAIRCRPPLCIDDVTPDMVLGAVQRARRAATVATARGHAAPGAPRVRDER
jgi:ADP-heptose:LPS heptosyltransferase